jgi:HSP20 family protein
MLVRWTPFNDVDRLMDRMLARGASETLERGVWHPAIDVTEDAEKIVLQGDFPGVDQQTLDIQIEQNVLTLKGERKLDRAEPNGELYRRYERTAGAFARQFKLPPSVDAEKVTASMKDGVLTLVLPKKAEALPRQIKVNLQ